MANDYIISLGAELNLNDINKEIANASKDADKFVLQLDTSDALKKINEIEKKIQALSKNKISININTGTGTGRGGGRGSNDDLTNAYKNLVSLRQRITSYTKQSMKLDGKAVNQQEFKALEDTLNKLKNEYKALEGTFGKKLSKVQIEDLNRALRVATEQTEHLKASLADTGAVNSELKQFKEIEAIAKRMNSLKLKIGSLDKDKNASEVAELNKQYDELDKTMTKLKALAQQPLTAEHTKALDAAVEETTKKLEQLAAKYEDTKRRMAEGLINSFDSKSASEFERVEAGMSKIQEKTQATTDAYNRFKSAIQEMELAKASGDYDRITQASEKYKKALQDIELQIKKNQRAESEGAALEQFENEKLKLGQNIQLWAKNNSAAMGQFGDRIKELLRLLEACNDPQTLKRLKNNFEALDREMKLTNTGGLNYINRFKDQMAKLGFYFSASTMILGTINGLRKMYDNVVKIDTAMTELKKVTDETDASYKNFLSNSGKAAQEIGTTIDDYISSTADFARLGYNFEESQNLAKVANVYNVVGDDLEGIGEATESVISTMKAFDIQAEDSISIIDKYNQVGNEFAISSGGIGDAMTRSASSLAAANNTIDESIALITAANSVVQNPDKVGNAFKTISMRIRGKFVPIYNENYNPWCA